MVVKEKKEYKISLDSRILSSSHISLLFGAGVNGRAFPMMSDFKETITLLEKELGREMINYEDDLEEITAKSKVERINNKFVQEFKKFENEIDIEHKGIKDLEELIQNINKLAINSENRTTTMKQINIYTLNYDEIVEEMLDRMGLLNNVISASNIDSHDKFFDLVGYDYNLKRYIPTYLVSKIHGDIDNPILPGRSKYDEALVAKRFEILFKMKSQLSRMNSILIVIGYAGRDSHINRLLKDCITSGLTIYWCKFSENDIIPDVIKSHTFIIDQADQNYNENMTKVFSNLLEVIWEEKSEE